MKRSSIQIAFATVAAIAGSSELAHAQEPLLSGTPIADNWTGFYTGAFAGKMWADVDVTELSSADFGPYFLPGVPYGFDASGAIAGGQAGYDWQLNRFVVGVGAEMGYLDLRGSVEDPNSLPTGAPVTTVESNLFGALTGRVGVAPGRVLGYVRGGIAFLDASGSTVDTCGRSFCGQTTIDASGEEVLTGWTLGGGLEVALSDRWSVGGEYRFYNFEDLEVSGISDPPAFYSQDIDVDFHTIRAFANYRW